MEKYDILKSDEDKFLLLNFTNLFKPTNISYYVEETIKNELNKSVNPIIDVEYVRYKPNGVYNLIPNFLLNDTYSPSYINAGFPINEHLTSESFRNTIFINEVYDGNDIQKNTLISKNLIKIDENNTYNIALNKEVSANLIFSDNIRNEFSYLYIPNHFITQNIDKVFLKLNLFNAKTGSKTSFTFNDEKINQSFFHQINLDNVNYTWSMEDTSPKEYKNIYLINKGKEENTFNQIMDGDDKKDNIILSTGEIISLKNKFDNTNIEYDLTEDELPIEDTEVVENEYISTEDKLSLGYQTVYGIKSAFSFVISKTEYITYSYYSNETQLYRPYFYMEYIPYVSSLRSDELQNNPKTKNYYFGDAIVLSANTWNNISFQLRDEFEFRSSKKSSFIKYRFGMMGKDSLINIRLLPGKEYNNYYGGITGRIARNIKIDEPVIINDSIESVFDLTDIDDQKTVDKILPKQPNEQYSVGATWEHYNKILFDEYKNKDLLIIKNFYKSTNININQPSNSPYIYIGVINIDFTPLESGIYTPYTVTNELVPIKTKTSNGTVFTGYGEFKKQFSIAPSKYIEAGVKTNFTFNIKYNDDDEINNNYVYFGVINKHSVAVLSDNPIDPDDYNKTKRIQPVNEFMNYEQYENKETIILKTENNINDIIGRLENIREIHNPYAKIKFDGYKDSNF